jgi:spore coat protein H
MRKGHSLAAFVILAMLADTLPAGAAYGQKEKRAPGEEIFDNKTVLPIRIDISSNELATLRRNDRKDVRVTVYEGSNVWRDVGLHVKGAAGSRRPIDDQKPALTLSFNRFIPDQKFHGLRKIHLNNSVQDGCYMCENICSELFRKAGVPTPRVSYATVILNGKKRGLYVLKEGFTKDMLGIYFKKTGGNLYDGGFLREINEQLENDGGSDDVKDWSDLKALAKAGQEPDPDKRWEELNRLLDVDRFMSYAALEVMTWDWDGYVKNRNNYRVYHDLDTSKMVFFPHGMDQMFWEPTGTGPKTRIEAMMPSDWFGPMLAQALIKNSPQGRRLYQKRFGEIYTNVFHIEMLTNRVTQLAALLRPHLGPGYEGEVRRIRDLIVGRQMFLNKMLSEPPPQPLAFASGVASITNWIVPLTPRDPANAIRDRVKIDGRQALHILTTNKTTNTSASWRASVLLTQGNYRFEALAKVAGVVSLMNANKGGGAGIRHSGIRKPRTNQLDGDSSWVPLQYEFQVPYEEDEVQLLCELRASQGEAWFDLESLRLVKVPPLNPASSPSVASPTPAGRVSPK